MYTQWIKKGAKASPLEPLVELEARRHAEGRQIDVWATTEDPRAPKKGEVGGAPPRQPATALALLFLISM